jgi:hypothetical protein
VSVERGLSSFKTPGHPVDLADLGASNRAPCHPIRRRSTDREAGRRPGRHVKRTLDSDRAWRASRPPAAVLPARVPTVARSSSARNRATRRTDHSNVCAMSAPAHGSTGLHVSPKNPAGHVATS